MSFSNLRSKLGGKRFNNVIHVSQRDRYVYISNPKAACSSIKLYLARCEKKDSDYTPSSLHKRRYLPFDGPNKFTSENLEKLFDGDFFIFTFVRHPLRRAVSAYSDKIIGNKVQKKEILVQLGRNPDEIDHPITFDEFVRVISSQKPTILNPHWRPQVFNLYPDIIKYDFIGHLELFDQDFEKVKKTLGLPDFPMNQKNVKSKRTDPGKLLTSINRFRLARLYAKDFIKFRYQPKGVEYLGVFFGYLPALWSLNIGHIWNRIKTQATIWR